MLGLFEVPNEGSSHLTRYGCLVVLQDEGYAAIAKCFEALMAWFGA